MAQGRSCPFWSSAGLLGETSGSSGVSQHDACNESQNFWDVEGHSASLPGAFTDRKLRLFDREWSKGDETRLDAVAQMPDAATGTSRF